jgi:hypothetical protein
VNRAALDGQALAPERHQRGFEARGAIDDYELGPLQAARIEVCEELAPGRGAFAAHVADGKQHLLTVSAHADRRQHRDVRGLPVQPRPDHRAVQDQTHDVLLGQAAGAPRLPVDLHLAPCAADHVLAHSALAREMFVAGGCFVRLRPRRSGLGLEPLFERLGLLERLSEMVDRSRVVLRRACRAIQ